MLEDIQFPMDVPRPSSLNFRRALFSWAGVGLALVVVFLGAGAWIFHGWVLRQAVAWGVDLGLSRAGWQGRFEQVTWIPGEGPGAGFTLHEVEARPGPPWPTASATRLTAEAIEVRFPSLEELWSQPGRFPWKLHIKGLRGVWDGRSASQPQVADGWALGRFFSFREMSGVAPGLSPWIPSRVEVGLPEVLFLGDGFLVSGEGWDVVVDDQRPGYLRWHVLEVELAGTNRIFRSEAVTARTAWRRGALYLANLELGPHATLHGLSVDLFRPGGLTVSLNADVWGGWLRGEWDIENGEAETFWEGTLWGGDWAVREMVQFLDGGAAAENTAGTVDSLRFTFRGLFRHWEKAEATLRLSARDVRWGKSGWGSLILGASASAGQVQLSELLLEQEGNRVEASGQVGWSLTEGWQDWRSWRGEWRAQGKIQNLAALAQLAGEPWEQMVGALDFSTKLRLENGGLEGAVQARGENLKWLGMPLGGARVAARWRGQEVEITEFLWENGADILSGKGRLRLAEPYVYEAQLEGNVRALQKYAKLESLFASIQAGSASAFLPEFAGGVQFEWHGDGSWPNHSGAFVLRLEKLRHSSFPQGLTARFEGTYSPENLYLQVCELRHAAWTLHSTLSAGVEGVFWDHIRLQSRGREFLAGQIYLPWNPLVLAAGSPWVEGVLPKRDIYADVRSESMEIKELAALIGQSVSMQGRVRVRASASGPLSAPRVEAQVGLHELRASMRGDGLLIQEGDIDFNSAEGRAQLKSSFTLPKKKTVRLEVSLPFGFAGQGEDLDWIDPQGEIAGSLVIPRMELAPYRFLFPRLRSLQGQLSAEVRLGNRLSQPSLHGEIRWRGGRLGAKAKAWPEATNISATVFLQGEDFTFADTTLQLGKGRLTISGGGNFSQFLNPEFSFQAHGREILLYRDSRLNLQAQVDLTLNGNRSHATLAGNLLFTKSRFFQRLEVTPLLPGSLADGAAAAVSFFDWQELQRAVPSPFANWSLDLHVANADSFLIGDDGVWGSFEPQVQVVGSLGAPRFLGEIVLRDWRIFFPYSVAVIPEGRIVFPEENSHGPEIDMEAQAQASDFAIHVEAKGKLREGNLTVQSDPPLSQEEIVLLLTAGVEPARPSESSLGEAAISSGGLVTGAPLVQHFAPAEADLALLQPELSGSKPEMRPGIRSRWRREFQANQQGADAAGVNGVGLLKDGVPYHYRFR